MAGGAAHNVAALTDSPSGELERGCCREEPLAEGSASDNFIIRCHEPAQRDGRVDWAGTERAQGSTGQDTEREQRHNPKEPTLLDTT